MSALITVAEADEVLIGEVYPEWAAIEDEVKLFYINRASAYVQLSWDAPTSDTDFDWTDDTTWDDEAQLKDCIAQYSDAISKGMIYAQNSDGSISQSPIKKKTLKAASLETTTEYAQPDRAAAKASIAPINDQMMVLGFTVIASRSSLTRV